MATQKTTFMETGHPFVRRIWKMLEQGIPPKYAVDAPRGMSQKSVTESAELRRLGDTSYSLKNFDQALIYYSKSVATAPAGTEELALAYGNRSAVFQSRMLYEPCLLDVNRALAGSLPPSIRQKLLPRKYMAWRKLQERNHMRKIMRANTIYMKLICRQKATLCGYQRRLYYISKVDVDDVDLVIDHSRLDDPIWSTKFDGTSLENVSPKIELKYDAEMGPYLVAKDDIKPGEPLYFEDVYSFSMREREKFKYCNYCHFQCEALIPCTHCTQQMYCSTGCREKAYDSYHRIECQLLPSWVGIAEHERELRVLHLRTFLRFTKQGSELANLMNSSVVCEALDGKLNCANVQFSPENYPILANTVSRLRYLNDDERISYQITLRQTIAIFAGLRSLQFFGSGDGRTQCSGNSLSELEYFGIMLLASQISFTWSHYFFVKYSLADTPAAPLRGKTEIIGHGLSLLQCFTLHSCNPNMGTVTNKRHMLAYSLRSIKAGEQIHPDRRCKYTGFSREERRKKCEYLGCPSVCTCKACVEDWPRLTEFLSGTNTYLTRDEGTLLRIQTMRKWLKERSAGSFRKKDLKRVIKFSRTIRRYVKEPSPIITLCEHFIQRVMFSKGNLFVVPK